jgi:hypothetical protein
LPRSATDNLINSPDPARQIKIKVKIKIKIMKTIQKKRTWLLVAAALVVVLVVMVWQIESKKARLAEDEAAKEKAEALEKLAQSDSEKNYYPYSSDFCEAFYQLIKTRPVDGDFELIQIPKGTVLSYNVDGNTFSGRTKEEGAVLKNNHGQVYTKNGVVETTDILFNNQIRKLHAKPFPLEWSADDLAPVIKKFPLTCFLDGWYLISNYEEFLQHYKPGENQCITFRAETSPGLMITSDSGEIYVMNKSGECWLTREESALNHGWGYWPNSTAYYGLY